MSNIIKGRWRWNDVVYCKWQATHEKYDIAFKCNAEAFCTIFLDWSVGYHYLTYIDVNSNYVLAGKSQNEGDDFYSVDEAYRIMDFGETDQLIDDELYNFISENAEPYLAPLTIAEKLAVIAENEPKVYNAGYNSGYKVGFEEGKAGDGYGEGFEAGKQAEYDAFWDAFQNSGTRTYYADAFRGATFEYIRPKHKITPKDKGGASRIFYGCNFLKKAEAAYIDFSQIPRGTHISDTYYNTFTMCYELEEVEDIGFVPTFGYGSTFNVCRSLRKIAVIRADAGTQFLNDTFGNCTALEEITFDGEIGSDINFRWSTKLTRASIESIINHLSDNVSGKTLTLSEAAVDKAFETEDLFGSETDEWATLCSSKPNWQITLV